MRLKIDENLPEEAAKLLTEAGHDATTVIAQNLGGRADHDVARVCASEGRALVTLDLDFADIRAFPPASHAGLIVLRPVNQAKANVTRLLLQVIACLPREQLTGRLWVADQAGIRVRD